MIIVLMNTFTCLFQMMSLYNLPDYDTPQEFFVCLAETTGKFKKGGIPDTAKAARQLIEDWNRYVNDFSICLLDFKIYVVE